MAEQVAEIFTEVIIAPSYADGAVEILQRKKNIRILEANPPAQGELERKQISGGVLVQQLLLLAQLAAAGCLVAGYRSRVSALCGWALFSSVINRNPLMAHGGDTLLRMELLLASFAPIASRCSVDAHAAATPATANTAALAPMTRVRLLAMFRSTSFGAGG